jgi:hypothetical protein
LNFESNNVSFRGHEYSTAAFNKAQPALANALSQSKTGLAFAGGANDGSAGPGPKKPNNNKTVNQDDYHNKDSDFNRFLRKTTGHDFGDWYDDFASKFFVGKSLANTVMAAMSAEKKARIFENFNAELFISAEVLDVIALKEHKITPAKFYENLAFGVIGFTKIGAPVSLIYFTLEAAYKGGANQAMRDFSSKWAKRSQAWGQIKMEQGSL